MSFDPNLALINTSPSHLLENIQEEIQLPDNLSGTLIHISSSDCDCNLLTKKHKYALTNFAKEKRYKIENVVLSQDMLRKSNSYIPSTPAVMLVGDNNQLIYFGPYAQGLNCSQQTGLVEVSLENYQKGYNPELILSQASGCYCHT